MQLLKIARLKKRPFERLASLINSIRVYWKVVHLKWKTWMINIVLCYFTCFINCDKTDLFGFILCVHVYFLFIILFFYSLFISVFRILCGEKEYFSPKELLVWLHYWSIVIKFLFGVNKLSELRSSETKIIKMQIFMLYHSIVYQLLIQL